MHPRASCRRWRLPASVALPCAPPAAENLAALRTTPAGPPPVCAARRRRRIPAPETPRAPRAPARAQRGTALRCGATDRQAPSRRLLRPAFRQLLMEPGLGQLQFAVDGCRRDIECGGGLLVSHAAEEQQLDDFALTRIERRQLLQRFIEVEHDGGR